jgi:hypothetical protein
LMAGSGRIRGPKWKGESMLSWLIIWHFYNGGFWFRVFGVGLSIVDRRKHPPLFSERTGRQPVLRIGWWSIKWLGRGRAR